MDISPMPNTIHVIPVSGSEPVHHANARCWCHPLITPEEPFGFVATHHAKDLREVGERHGHELAADKCWINVWE